LVIIGGVVSTITALMSDWSISALTDGGVEDPASAVSGFGLTAAFTFYGVTIGFLLAGSTMVKTLLFGSPQATGISVSSDISVYNLVEGSTSVRTLLGRGVGMDTTLIIGSSEDESKGGMTIIEVSADLHQDKVDEFPVEFDENLVTLTRWLCGRGTTTAQFFSWADVDNSGEVDMFEFANALSVADIADLPPWDITKLVEVLDINGDGRLNLPELDIALLNIRNKLGIEFIAFEATEEVEEVEEPAEMVEESEDDTESESEESESEVDDEVDLSKMKKAELVEMAKSMGLPSSGNKAVLIDRISKA
jgi:Ca2+-binding EF-hand superfamily protein